MPTMPPNRSGPRKFIGVRLLAGRGRWIAILSHAALWKNEIVIAQFDDAETAAAFRDRVALYYQGDRAQLNFPRRKARPLSLDEARREARLLWHRSRGIQSRFRGVRPAPRGRWHAMLWDGTGVPRHLGTWPSEEQAARAYDRGVRHYGLRETHLNFPSEDLAAADADTLAHEARQFVKARTSSRFLGVTWNEQRQKWVAKVGWTSGGRMNHRTLGYFDDERAAARARDRAGLEIWGDRAKLNFHPETGEPLYGRRPPQDEAAG